MGLENTLKSFILILFIIVFGSCNQDDNIIHVSSNIKDTNPQTITSIQKAVDLAKPGQIISIHKGIYREQVKIPKDKKGLKLFAYKNDKPIIKGSDIVIGWTKKQNYWFKLIKIQPQQVMIDGDNPLQQIGYPNESFIKNDTKRKRYQFPIGKGLKDMQNGRFFWANDTLFITLKDGSDPNKHKVEVSQRESILTIKADSVHIKGLTFRHSNSNTFREQGAAVRLGNYSVIEDCDVQWCDFGGISFGYKSKGAKAIRCNASHNGATGFNASASEDFLISECKANHNNYRNFYALWHAGGFKAASSAWGTVENSEFANNIGAGIWFDYCFERAKYRNNGQKPIIIRNNYIHSNSLYPEKNHNAAVMLEVSEKIDFYNNILVNNGHRGVYVSASWDVNILNNTFIGTTGYCTIDIAGIPRGDNAKLTNVTVKNNLVYNSKTLYDLHLLKPNNNDIDLPSCNNNLYFRSGDSIKLWYSTDGRDEWKGEVIKDLKEWQNITGFDKYSSNKNPILDKNDIYFLPKDNSPIIDAGNNYVSDIFKTDFKGNPRFVGKSVDIGALEIN